MSVIPGAYARLSASASVQKSLKEVCLSSSLLLKGGTIVTMNTKREVLKGDVLVRDGMVTALGDVRQESLGSVERVIDVGGCYVLPGFVQTHVHLCQTLFKGLVEYVGLGKWLERIWNLEAAHDPRSMHRSAVLGCCELLKSGTTCILDMGSVHHEDQVFQALSESGIRAYAGKAMMDRGDSVPVGLQESTRQSIEETLSLISRWHGANGGRVHYAPAPRFMESCSEELLRTVAEKAHELHLLVHTHAAETDDELSDCETGYGMSPVAFLHSIGLTGKHVVLAHCVHLRPQDFMILSETQTKVAHCPSSNLKLSSGIADVGRMFRSGVKVSLGCDGAPCNNNLDMISEMRHAALLQRYLNGDEFQWAQAFLEAATLGGAEALGLGSTIGSIELNKRADVIALDVSRAHTFCGEAGEPSARIVFSAKGSDVKLVMVDGEVLVENGSLTKLDEEEIVAKSSEELKKLVARSD